jgi:hypothetical protein
MIPVRTIEGRFGQTWARAVNSPAALSDGEGLGDALGSLG